MVDISIKDGELKVNLQGNSMELGAEITALGKAIASRNKELASHFILGMSRVISKENLTRYVERAYDAQDLAKTLSEAFSLKDLDELMKGLKSILGAKDE